MSSFDSSETGDRLASGWERHRRSIFENTRAASDWLDDRSEDRFARRVALLDAVHGRRSGRS